MLNVQSSLFLVSNNRNLCFATCIRLDLFHKSSRVMLTHEVQSVLRHILRSLRKISNSFLLLLDS